MAARSQIRRGKACRALFSYRLGRVRSPIPLAVTNKTSRGRMSRYSTNRRRGVRQTRHSTLADGIAECRELRFRERSRSTQGQAPSSGQYCLNRHRWLVVPRVIFDDFVLPELQHEHGSFDQLQRAYRTTAEEAPEITLQVRSRARNGRRRIAWLAWNKAVQLCALCYAIWLPNLDLSAGRCQVHCTRRAA